MVGGIARTVQGRDREVHEDLLRAVSEIRDGGPARGSASVRAVRLADVAVGIGAFDIARELLDLAPDSQARAVTRARLHWQQGDMSEAIAALATAGRRGRRLRARYAAEKRVFDGWEPVLPQTSTAGGTRAGSVLHVLTNSLPHTGSGYAQRSHSILTAERDLGWSVSAVTRLGWPVLVGRPMAGSSDVVDGVLYRRLLPGRIPEELDGRLQLYAEALADVVREAKPAVLHTTTDFFNAVVVRAVARAFGLPWVYEVRGQLADTWASTRGPDAYDSEKYRLFRDREAQAAKDASAVVTLGRVMQSELVSRGVDESQISVCPNAVGESFLLEPVDRMEAIRQLGLDPQATYVGTVSSIVSYEGLDDLLEAFAMVAADHPDARLLIAGDGAALPGLKQLAARLGIEDRTHFAGRVSRADAHLYHRALSVFAVPRKDLSVTRSVTPLKSVEASASARPVVATRLPALEELVHDGETGLLFEPGSVDDLASKVGRLLADPVLRDGLGQRGREWVLEERTWAANAARYDRVYRDVLR
ncbi:glycosyltransferase [Zhihengliuella salsuginis]|uniref:glycosyltransferase n=1 Tax=Zhihengliuella salsuginis TaxID=578222 RepID=UPI001E491525|nr:glycosyltransferase [Zhihengliuella salsuginis]